MTGAGVEYRANSRFVPDNMSIRFGTEGDARLYYDGSDLVVSPAEVGTGDLKVSGASLLLDSGEKIDFGAGDVMLTHAAGQLQVDGGDLIVTDGDGLVVGHTARLSVIGETGEFQVLGTGGTDSSMTLGSFRADSAGPVFKFIKSRAATIGGSGAVADGDTLGQLLWGADDGTDYASFSVQVLAQVDGTPGGNDVPGRLIFGTTADGAAGAAERMRIDSAGGVFIGETANANMTVGLTINQGANDDDILALKSSDVGHVLTGLAEADTFGQFGKVAALAGGLLIRGLRDGDHTANKALLLQGVLGEAADTTDTSGSDAVTQIMAGVTDGGASITDVAATGNAIAFENNATTLAIIKGNGDWHVTTLDATNLDSVAATALDDMPDALAGRALRTDLAGHDLRHGVNVYNPGLVQKLEDHGVVFPKDETGHRFMSLQAATYFAWDMAFQNAMWLRDIAGVLKPEQRAKLPAQTREMLALMPAGG